MLVLIIVLVKLAFTIIVLVIAALRAIIMGITTFISSFIIAVRFIVISVRDHHVHFTFIAFIWRNFLHAC